MSALKKGDHVMMYDCSEAELYPGKIFTARSEPWKLDHGAEVILLEGRTGGFSTEYLKKIWCVPVGEELCRSLEAEMDKVV